MTATSPHKHPNLIINFTILTAYFHAFMEWLFFVTKPSSLSTLSQFDRIKIFFVTGGILSVILLAVQLLLAIPARRWKSLAHIPAALMLSITALIMLDNFTYTVFKFGIVTTLGAWRIIYTVIFILVLRWMFRYVQRQKPWKYASFLTLSLLAVSTGWILTIHSSRSPYLTSMNIRPLKPSAERPNIIILGADGLNAGLLSAYGYTKDTTPFLALLAKTSLVAENAFSNASSTTASTTTILTGKEPAEVNVYRYPDILADEDSFEHLPSILKHQGYQTVEIGTSYYVDATELNLLDGFDIVNNETFEQPWLDALRYVLGNSPSTYFIQMVIERVEERLLHIFFIKEMDNPFEEVNNPRARMTDAERVEQIIDLLENSKRPVFIFSHFMDTHGPHFGSGSSTLVEESLDEDEEWDVERYQGAIREFDGHVRDIYAYLSRTGKLDNTIIVIYTDHGFQYVVNKRIPVMIHFPNNEHMGTRKNNIQVIDVPITLLDYLGITKPEWMTGESFLRDEPPAMRQIISITAGSPKKIAPPFYQIKIVQVVVCQRWYALNVQDKSWKSGMISGHTATCDLPLLPADGEIKQHMLDYLEKYDYDISSLQ